jgi:transcriptional regulator with XRE-family HTH domain
VDADPVRIHLKDLQAAGLGLRRIADLSGVSRKQLHWILYGRKERGTPPSRQILGTNAEAILAVPVPELIHQVASDSALVPAYGTTRRLQALVALGYTQHDLAARLGLLDTNLARLVYGPPVVKRGRRKRITAKMARKVEALYAELSETPGPSRRSLNRAKALGWLPPIAWDEDVIDLPHPWLDRRAARGIGVTTESSLLTTYDDLRAVGYTLREIGAKLGLSEEELVKALKKKRRLTQLGEI